MYVVSGPGCADDCASCEKRPTNTPSTTVPRYHCQKPVPFLRNSSRRAVASQLMLSSCSLPPFSLVRVPWKVPGWAPLAMLTVRRKLLADRYHVPSGPLLSAAAGNAPRHMSIAIQQVAAQSLCIFPLRVGTSFVRGFL